MNSGIPKSFTPGVLDGQAKRVFMGVSGASLAIALHDATGWPIEAFVDYDSLANSGPITNDTVFHWAIRRPDGMLIDVEGAHEPDDLEEAMSLEHDVGMLRMELSRSDVEQWTTARKNELCSVHHAASLVQEVLKLAGPLRYTFPDFDAFASRQGINPASCKFHNVHDLSSDDPSLMAVGQLRDGRFLIHYNTQSGSSDEHDYCGIPVFAKMFANAAELRVWLTDNKVVPAQYVADLTAGKLTPGVTYAPSIDDIRHCSQRAYRVSWSLSYESPETNNEASFSTLHEAQSFLNRTGAQTAIPGNAGCISIGSVILYHSHFTSDGIDQGDSHVNPGSQQIAHALYREILSLEALEAAEQEMEQSYSFCPGM